MCRPLRVTFLGYFLGTDAYFCGFLLGPVYVCILLWGRCPDIYLHSTCEQFTLLISFVWLKLRFTRFNPFSSHSGFIRRYFPQYSTQGIPKLLLKEINSQHRAP